VDTLEELKKAQAEQATEENQETHPEETLETDDQTTDQEEPNDSENEEVADAEGSQPKEENLTKGMQKRLAKEKTRQYAIQAELEKERKDKDALQAQLDARRPDVLPDAPIQPNADDFDLGRDDPAFIKADKAFDRYAIKQEIVTEIDQTNKTSVISQQANERAIQLKDATNGHYERAGKIEVDDYLEVEKRAVNIIGKDVADAIVMDFPDSQDLFYHLGENTEKAQEVNERDTQTERHTHTERDTHTLR